MQIARSFLIGHTKNNEACAHRYTLLIIKAFLHWYTESEPLCKRDLFCPANPDKVDWRKCKTRSFHRREKNDGQAFWVKVVLHFNSVPADILCQPYDGSGKWT